MQIKVFLAISLFAISTGCATTIPTDITLMISSIPEGATVMTSDGHSCTTPCSYKVDRDQQLSLKATYAGYQSMTSTVEVPAFQRSHRWRDIAAGIGVLTMYVGADIAEDLGSAIAQALVGEDLDVLSTGEKLGSALAGGLVFGGIGHLIDREINKRRAAKPLAVTVVLNPE